MPGLLITVDGPAGAGKTTVSRLLAERLGYRYVDTGALYRGVAYAVKRYAVDEKDRDAMQRLCVGIRMTLVFDANEPRLVLDGVDVTDKIRTPEVTMLASAVSAQTVVRAFLLDRQRALGRAKNAVFEGRDMGTVVFPEADVKFFLDAELKTRAYRRYREFAASNRQTLAQVRAAMTKRDRNDSHREIAPLKAAGDAVKIDATHLDVEAVVSTMMAHVERKFNSTSKLN